MDSKQQASGIKVLSHVYIVWVIMELSVHRIYILNTEENKVRIVPALCNIML